MGSGGGVQVPSRRQPRAEREQYLRSRLPAGDPTHASVASSGRIPPLPSTQGAVRMLKILLWIIVIIFLIGLLVVSGVLGMIF